MERRRLLLAQNGGGSSEIEPDYIFDTWVYSNANFAGNYSGIGLDAYERVVSGDSITVRCVTQHGTFDFIDFFEDRRYIESTTYEVIEQSGSMLPHYFDIYRDGTLEITFR